MKIESTQTGENATVKVTNRPSMWAVIAGLMFFVVGAAVIAVDSVIAIGNKQALHTTHLILGGGLCVVGIVVMFSFVVIPPLKSLNVIIAPYVPMIGGRRASDPKADDASVTNVPSAPPTPPTREG